MSAASRWRYAIIAMMVVAACSFVALPRALDRVLNGVFEPAPYTVSENSSALHGRLFVADLHSDSLLWPRDLLRRSGHGHVDVPRLIEGNVALQVFTVVSKVPAGLNFERNTAHSDRITLLAVTAGWPPRTWRSLKERALYQAEKLRRFAAASDGRLTLIRTHGDLVDYLRRRERSHDMTAGILGIEGAQVLEGDARNVEDLFNAGFRTIGLAHFFDNEIAGSAHGEAKGGLTDTGRQALARMERLGILVDVAHASPATIEEVLGLATRPVIASHTGAKGACDRTRNLSDEQLRGIAASGGVIGIAYFEEAICGTDVDAIVRSIRYGVDVAGIDHIALGSDFDGAIRTVFDTTGVITLTSALLGAGFSESDIAKIMGENVKRLLLETLPR